MAGRRSEGVRAVDEGISVFVDESGDANLATEKDGVSGVFVLCAVITTDGAAETLRRAVQSVRSRHFGAGEMKSSSIGADTARRIRVLEDVVQLDFTAFVMVVDKAQVHRDSGLQYPKSFRKFITRLVYERICRRHDYVSIVADEHGRSEFMLGFKRYVDRELERTLFSRRDFAFARSETEPLIQLADLLAGSVLHETDPKKTHRGSSAVRRLIGQRAADIVCWPWQAALTSSPLTERATDDRLDELVRRYSMKQVGLHLDRLAQKATLDGDERLQMEVLRVLLFHAQFEDASSVLSSDRLLRRLRRVEGMQIGREQLGRHMGALRDAGVVIASSRRKGYRLPQSVADMRDYVAYANTIVPPLLARVNIARQALAENSQGALDITAEPQFDCLRLILDHLPHAGGQPLIGTRSEHSDGAG